MLFNAAYNDNCDYLMHIVDDVVIQNKEFLKDSLFAMKTISKPKNFGVIGSFRNFVTQPLVHRNYMEASLGNFYPAVTKNWWSDTALFYSNTNRFLGNYISYFNPSIDKTVKKKYQVCNLDEPNELIRIWKLKMNAYHEKIVKNEKKWWLALFY